MKDSRRWIACLVAAVMLCGLAWSVSMPTSGNFAQFTGRAFATTYKVTYAYGPDVEAVQLAVQEELDRIDAMASTWRDDSELMRYNHAADPGTFKLSQELADLIERAQQIEVQTGGAFSLRPDGRDLDLSAIAKGYAVDRVAELMQNRFGITDGLVDIGGEVCGFGDGPKGDGWRVGLYAPQGIPNSVAAQTHLQLHNTSIATSGDSFKGDHLLDPATGQPVANDLCSASVIQPSNATADAYATALYVMGHDRGLAWAKENGTQVVFLLRDGTRRENVPD
jgi:thiamine biosynthesis lipoprotein